MSFIGRMTLVHGLLASKQYGPLVEAAQRAIAISARHSWPLSSLAAAYAGCGRLDAARAILGELTSRSQYTWVLPTDLAIASLACGLTDEALGHLARGFEERDPRLLSLDSDYFPDFRPLRENAAYGELRARLGWAI
jgi:hypothetical protein